MRGALLEKEEHIIQAPIDGKEKSSSLTYALTCMGLDLINTPLELATKRLFNHSVSVSFCACPAHRNDGKSSPHHHESLAKEATRWFLAEQFGDLTGAFITNMAKEHAEPMLGAIQNVAIYVAGDLVRFGADHNAKQWGLKNGFEQNSPEVKARSDEIYKYGIEHIPEAVLWNFASLGTTLTILKVTGDQSPVLVNAAVKLTGSVLNSGLTTIARALLPETAQKIDGWCTENILAPVADVVGGVFGNKKQTIETQNNKEWHGKIAELNKQLATLNSN